MSLITVSSFTIPADNVPDGPLTLRLWYTQGFLDSSGQLVLSGTSTTGTQLRFDATASGGVITVDPLSIYSTLDAQVPYPQTIQIACQMFRGNTALRVFPFSQDGCPSQWIVPDDLGASITFETWTLANQRIVLQNPPQTFYTAAQVDALLNSIAYAPATTSSLGLTEISVTPVNPLRPIAVGDNDLRVAPAGAFYYASHYDTFADALVSMGNSRVRLIVSEPMTVGSGTVPETVTLEFTATGQLTINTGTTLNVLGPILAPPIQIFDVSVGIATCTANNIQKRYWVEWWGAKGDNSTDNLLPLNAAFAAMPFAATLQFAGHGNYLISQTDVLTVDHQFNLTVTGIDGDVSLTSDVPIILYSGISDGGAVLTLNNVYTCTFRGFGVFGHDGVHGKADVGIYLTMTAGGNPGLTSHCAFHGVATQAASTTSGWIGLKIDNAAGVNNEQHSIKNCWFVGGQQAAPNQTGTGIYLGHANVKQILIEACSFIGLAKNVETVSNPSYRAKNNIHAGCHTAYYGGASDVVTIEGDDSEQLISLLFVPLGFNVVASIKGVRVGDVKVSEGSSITVPFIQTPSGSLLVVEGCMFGQDTPSFGNKLVYDPTGTSSIRWQLNRVASISNANMIAALNTFLYSEDDARAGGLQQPGGLSIRGSFGLIRNNADITGATPDLSASNYSTRYTFLNGGATTITDFLNGYDGMVIIVKGDANTSIQNNANIVTRSGADITPFNGKTNTFLNDNGVWRQIN